MSPLRGQIHDRTVAALYAQEQGIGRPGERTALRVGHARLQQLHGDLRMTANHRRLRGIQPHIAHAFLAIAGRRHGPGHQLHQRRHARRCRCRPPAPADSIRCRRPGACRWRRRPAARRRPRSVRPADSSSGNPPCAWVRRRRRSVRSRRPAWRRPAPGRVAARPPSAAPAPCGPCPGDPPDAADRSCGPRTRNRDQAGTPAACVLRRRPGSDRRRPPAACPRSEASHRAAPVAAPCGDWYVASLSAGGGQQRRQHARARRQRGAVLIAQARGFVQACPNRHAWTAGRAVASAARAATAGRRRRSRRDAGRGPGRP